MLSPLDNFIELFERNIDNHHFSRNLILLHTEEYTELAIAIFKRLKLTFNVSIKKLPSIFDSHLENYILEKDIFLLFYSMPWEKLKNYYSQVRPILTRHANRSFVIRDCLNDFINIYQTEFNKIAYLHSSIIKHGNHTRKVTVKNHLGTELEFLFPQQTIWRHIDGTNIPNEILPSEISNHTPLVNGQVVFTGILLSLVPIGKKYGLIKDPIHLSIENGFIQKIHCDNKALETDLHTIYQYCEGNKEIVELGIGTNLNINLNGTSAPFEERKAGFHLGTGGYQPKSQHIDFVFDSAEIYFDEHCLFANNQFDVG